MRISKVEEFDWLLTAIFLMKKEISISAIYKTVVKAGSNYIEKKNTIIYSVFKIKRQKLNRNTCLL